MEEELALIQNVYQQIIEFMVNYSFQILGALIVLMLGIFIASKFSLFVEKLMVGRSIDVTLSHFTASFFKSLIIIMVAIIALEKIGISVTPFVAVIGTIGLGAGLAMQGLLSNYGAGISIIVARPFIVGDTISVQGVSGVVKEVKLAYTILGNEDDVAITIPNKHIVGEIIHNSQANSIVETSIGVAYASDPDQAVAVIKQALLNTEGVNTEKGAQVGIDNFGDSSINIGMRYWVPTHSLFETKYKANQAVFKALADNNIEIPFPQRHVHLFEQKE